MLIAAVLDATLIVVDRTAEDPDRNSPVSRDREASAGEDMPVIEDRRTAEDGTDLAAVGWDSRAARAVATAGIAVRRMVLVPAASAAFGADIVTDNVVDIAAGRASAAPADFMVPVDVQALVARVGSADGGLMVSAAAIRGVVRDRSLLGSVAGVGRMVRIATEEGPVPAVRWASVVRVSAAPWALVGQWVAADQWAPAAIVDLVELTARKGAILMAADSRGRYSAGSRIPNPAQIVNKIPATRWASVAGLIAISTVAPNSAGREMPTGIASDDLCGELRRDPKCSVRFKGGPSQDMLMPGRLAFYAEKLRREVAMRCHGGQRLRVKALFLFAATGLLQVGGPMQLVAARADDVDPATSGVKALAEALKDSDADVRKSAALSLGRFGPKAESAVSALSEALKDKVVDVRGAASVALGRIGPGAKDAALPLAELLKDKQSDVRGAAALALARIGKAANAAVPALVEVTKGDDALSAVYARGALALLDDHADSHVAAIAESLADKKAEVRGAAAYVLAELGPAAKAAIPALVKALGDQDLEVRRGVARALAEMGSDAEGEIAGLIDALKDADTTVRSQIILTLAEIGPAAKSAVPRLVELGSDKSVDVRGAAVYALGEIGWADKTVVYALSKAIKDDDAEVRKAAALALGKLESDESP